LLDSVAVMVETMSAAFRTIGAPVPDEKAIRAISGLHVRRALESLMPGASDARIDELIAAYAPYLKMHVWRTDDGWICLTGQKPV
jgi:hypothetical protein